MFLIQMGSFELPRGSLGIKTKKKVLAPSIVNAATSCEQNRGAHRDVSNPEVTVEGGHCYQTLLTFTSSVAHSCIEHTESHLWQNVNSRVP